MIRARRGTTTMRVFCILLIASSLMILASCAAKEEKGAAGLKKQSWGKASGADVDLYTLTNRNGMSVEITNYGGRVVTLKVPDRNGAFDDVVLGFDSLEGYLGNNPYFGAIVGRYGNRIAKGRFTLDGKEYHLPINNGENSLHGGLKGFDKVVWNGKDASGPDGPAVELMYLSRDGEEGYPGNLAATVRYTLTDNNELKIHYTATTDKPTVLNLTNHSYFNLAGQGKGDILGHEMMINADRYTPVDAGLIPTGELAPVLGTPFDFRQPTAIGARINANNEQLKIAKGYDHNFVLNTAGSAATAAIRVHEPKTGRVMEVYTDQPGVQFYTGNFLDGTIHGKGGKAYGPRAAFCLETQHFPDSPNHSNFPSTALRPGETYNTTTIYKFSTDAGK
ncbi:MAG TPA: aldose epimerase family protein [Bryobacteraceae bacterium]|jgi:aldose 1-epimerase|nr:aldose epimerase family protein [Bryobacteraceae bacterium]